ncbi:TonB-dependent receptor [Marinoscillum furvescens]|uniref:TonB-dependent receptor-like protein n=1 Tax=Marinoscillum furvescens DSM 4134 TaxID=1122208 RepID=A0A3D9LGT1_MARFU|nr:carboxypeptidase-like regulatory domain-containing protein [Marinoscillum furvescens]REE05664.1 TonB-dependent receptor-like protein [Marinoscillum furvescens DSM 4134]
MKNLWLLAVLWLLASHAFGQYRISGYVEDESSREKLFGATVVVAGTTTGTTSNFYGYFSMPLSRDSVTLAVSFVGYQTKYLTLSLTQDTSMTIALPPMVELEAVVVEGAREEVMAVQPQVSSINIPSKQLMQLPAIAGEIDLLRGLQLLPGVQSGTEGLTGIYVRGGGPDQNLILLDGVPLYSVSHLGGLFSVFNPDVISGVNLIKGGFPARYGGRLSSVINVKVKDGNRAKRQTSGAIGLVSARLTTEGPLAQGKGSYMVGLRRTYIDLFTRPISRAATDGEVSFGYLFYDFNGKATYDLGPKDKLSVSVYSGDDKGVGKFDDDESNSKTRFQWGNFLATARWNHLISDRLFTNLSLNYTRYRFLVGFEQEDTQDNSSQFYEYRSGIQDVGARYEMEYYLSKKHQLLTGMQLTQHYFTPGVNAFKSEDQNEKSDTTFGSFNITAQELSWYLEDQWEISRRFKLNAGAHLNFYHVDGKTFSSLQPRATLRMLTGKYASFKLSYAAMQQNVHLLSSSGVGLPTDLWVPATRKVRPQISHQVTVAYSQQIAKGVELSAEVYAKRMNHLIAYSEGENWLSGGDDWQERVESDGEGASKGLEVFLHKKEGRFTGWVGYTLSKTDRQFEEINYGEPFPYRFDRRHDIGILLTYRINERIDISATWVYGTGNAITLGEGRYLAVGYGYPSLYGDFPNDRYYNDEVEIYNGRNGFRMKPYHRADFGIRFTKAKKWGERTWNLGFYNAYNRANPFYYYWADSYNNTTHEYEGRKLKQIALFPIIPAFSYEFKF